MNWEKILEDLAVDCMEENPDNKDRTLNLSKEFYLNCMRNSAKVFFDRDKYQTAEGVIFKVVENSCNSNYFEKYLIRRIKTLR